MRSEAEMYALILGIARSDERIRGVILNGSRANPQAPSDIFQDFDVIYVVTELAAFKNDPHWIDKFGERMILQLPDDMGSPVPSKQHGYAYLMQFADGNRIDLCLYPRDKLSELPSDSLSVLLLDKDGLVEPFPPPDERDYLPKPPSAKAYADCCNEFWWCCPYVAKGLWRGEIPYAKFILDQVVREELMKMLAWQIGVRTGFAINPGKFGKYFQRYLEPEAWELFLQTYTGAEIERNWEAIAAMGRLFRSAALEVAGHFGFQYPHQDDARVSAHLEHVRKLPRDAQAMY